MASVPVFELPRESQMDAVGHYWVRNYDDFAVEWMTKLCGSIFGVNPFGLENYKNEGAAIQKIVLKSSAERPIAVKAVRNILERRGIQVRALDMVVGILDELLMNAIFDAPSDWNGKMYRKEIPRETICELNDREKVTLTLVFNEKFVALSVLDQFGSFRLNSALDLIRKDYKVEDYQVNQKVKGAGLGLRGIVDSGVSLVIRSRLSVDTEAIIGFPYYKTFKQTKTGFRSFSFNIFDPKKEELKK